MEKIDGKLIAEKVLETIKNEINVGPIKAPVLSIILVGDDEGSKVYVERKRLAAEKVGIQVKIVNLDNGIIKNELVKIINELADESSGLILQLPLPKNLRPDTDEILNYIPINKDVDCLKNETLRAAANGEIKWLPPIVEAVDAVMTEVKIDLSQKKICLVGRGKVTGLPLLEIYQARKFDVVVVDSQTENISAITRLADVVISATGSAHLITGDMIKDNCLIIDAGFARKDGKIVGDVNNCDFVDRSVILCPSPGGIGPITVATLLLNVVKAGRNEL